VLDALTIQIAGANTLKPTPACLLIDDGQFSRSDPSLSGFVESLLERAFAQKWPLLIIVTHWQKEWREDYDNDALTIAAAIRKQQHRLGDGWQPVELPPIADLAPMLNDALPGLLPQQQSALLTCASGNPRYLDEIIRLCLDEVSFFIGLDPSGPMDEEGLQACLNESLDLHILVKNRLKRAPLEVQQAVVLSSLQGVRFLTQLTQEVAQALDINSAAEGLNGAEHPHSLINALSGSSAEFTQRIFHEVAQKHLRNMPFKHKAHAVLEATLRQRLDDALATPGVADAEQRELTLALAAGLFESADAAEDRQRAVQALAELTTIELAQYDYTAAQRFAQRIMTGVNEERWQLEMLSFLQLWKLQEALETMGDYDSSLKVTEAMQTDAQHRIGHAPDDLRAQRDLSLSWEKLGDIARRQGDLTAAQQLFEKMLVISEPLAERLGTPEAQRDLSLSWEKLGDIALR